MPDRTARLGRGGASTWVRTMGDAPDNYEPARADRRPGERMKEMQAKNETFKADLAATQSGMRANMAQRDAALSDRIASAAEKMATASDRNATARLWQTGALLAGIAIAIAVFIAAS